MDGATCTVTASTSDGTWACELPAKDASGEPAEVTVSSSSGESITLTDVLIGDVFFCSGQSNMQLSVLQTMNGPEEAANASAWADMLRSVYVALDDSYFNVSEPQEDFIPSWAWARTTSDKAGDVSAVCFYHAKELLRASSSSSSSSLLVGASGGVVPIGIISSSWGGTAIQPWMPEEAIAQCSDDDSRAAKKMTTTKKNSKAKAGRRGVTSNTNPDPGLGFGGHRSGGGGGAGDCLVPCVDSTLYNSMVAPFTHLPVAGWLWYQGEANVGSADSYACLFPAMIDGWRKAWSANTAGAQDAIAAAAAAPFVFAQVSSWPNGGDNSAIPLLRESQEAPLFSLANVAMAVAADIGDPASAFHPIHPPYKQELARRMALQTTRIQSSINDNKNKNKNKNKRLSRTNGASASNDVIDDDDDDDVLIIPSGGPRPVSVVVDNWNESWGDYHVGYGGNGNNYCSMFSCLGVRVTFDQPVAARSSYGLQYGFGEGGFELLSALDCGSECDFQPAVFTGILDSDARTVQLNVTWVYSEAPLALRYAWRDYPNMPLTNGAPFDLPAPPFRMSLVEQHD
jgi:hypothetical protein